MIIIIALQAYHTFFSMYKFQNPIVIELRSPVVSKFISPVPTGVNIMPLDGSEDRGRGVSPTPTPSKKGLIKGAQAQEVEILHTEIFDKVWMLESTQGRAPSGWHIACRSRGEWNEIGYAPYKHCFANKTEGMIKLGTWFQNKFEKGYTTDEALCMWNVGKRLSECPYSVTYHTL